MQSFLNNKITKRVAIPLILVIGLALNFSVLFLNLNVVFADSTYNLDINTYKLVELFVRNGSTLGSLIELFPFPIIEILSFSLFLVVGLTILFTFILKEENNRSYHNLFVLFTVNFAIVVIQILLAIYTRSYSAGAYVLLGLNLVLLLLDYVYIGLLSHYATSDESKETKIEKSSKIMNMVMAVVALIFSFAIFFVPIYSISSITTSTTFITLFSEFLTSVSGNINTDGENILLLSILIVFIIFFIIQLAYYISSLKYYYADPDTFYHRSHITVILSFVGSIIFLFFGYAKVIFNQDSNTTYISYSYIPFIFSSIWLIIIYAFSSKYENAQAKEKEKNAKSLAVKRGEIFSTVILLAASFVGSLFVDLINIKVHPVSGGTDFTIQMNCISLLTRYNELTNEYKTVVFFLIVALVIIGIFVVSSLALMISKSKLFTKISFMGIIFEFLFMFALSLFGIYTTILEKITEDTLLTIIAAYGFSSFVSVSSVTLNTYTFIFLIVDCAILFAIMLLKPFSSFNDNDEIDVNIKASDLQDSLASANNAPISASNDNQIASAPTSENKEENLKDFDACPAFSELDSLKPLFDKQLEKRKEFTFGEPSLVSITNFVVDYAKNSRLHLFYQNEDIATFIAGLGMTRLSILQGMSGTGKTSLPKIFVEALMGNCEIIEVESSWKDKNELIGYYNDFSKTFTPKKFTQALYKASLNPEFITLVVLDEMNLSRIEYYFSDFLSLMENEEDKREIKLLNVKLYNTVDGERKSYLSLKDDHTLKIPKNVYFIGTANRDESTFEISDKVYDRANTMNFDKRAKPSKDFTEPLKPKYLSYKVFRTLLDNAKSTYQFTIEDNLEVKRVEELLAPYNISFGNRVYNQIENFVKVYCSCFENPQEVEKDALEKIIYSKVVHKLEFKSIDDKDYLVHEFEKIGYYKCAEFISKLNGDF